MHTYARPQSNAELTIRFRLNSGNKAANMRNNNQTEEDEANLRDAHLMHHLFDEEEQKIV